jgi:hypothetical protein
VTVRQWLHYDIPLCGIDGNLPIGDFGRQTSGHPYPGGRGLESEKLAELTIGQLEADPASAGAGPDRRARVGLLVIFRVQLRRYRR